MHCMEILQHDKVDTRKKNIRNEIVMAEVTDTCCYILVYCLDIFSHILSLTEIEDFIRNTQYKQCGVETNIK